MAKSPFHTKTGMLLTLSVLWGVPALAWSGADDDSAPEPSSGKRAVFQEAGAWERTAMPAAHRLHHYRSDSTENILSAMSKEVAGKVFYEMKDEGQQAMGSRVAVVCAVPLSDLKRETEFGRVIAEYYLTDLADRGIQVKELRLGKEINILPQTGEFILSQNIGELATDSPALDYVVVSTFSNTQKTLILQGRMISLQTGVVKTSWRYNIPLNRDLMALLDTNDQLFTIAVKGIGDTTR